MSNDTTCKIEGCERPHQARGWCELHYRRWRKRGDPLATSTPTRATGTTEERFWAKVDATGDCWEWNTEHLLAGYGRFWDGKRDVYSHRFAWETLVGPVPAGLQLDHLCRNRACCNPDHLEVVTPKINALRGEGPSAANARKTHCLNNHEFTDENTANRSDGGRRCRKCHSRRTLEWYHANKDK
jgi:hypothetical protein